MAESHSQLRQAPVQETWAGDGELLSRHLAGDRGAFGELMATYSAPIYGYLVRCGVSAPDRDDLYQDIFCRVHRAASSYDSNRPLPPWLFAIVANTVRNHFTRGPGKRSATDSVSAADQVSPQPGPQAVVEAHETAHWLQSELHRLPLVQREVVVLCCIEQLEQKAVSQALGLPVNTVKTHLRRARLAMAKSLARRRRIAGREVSR